MWLMSNTPAPVRTAVCSSTMLVYCTGMSQPPNSAMRAPWELCQSNRGVRKAMQTSLGAGGVGSLKGWGSSCKRERIVTHAYRIGVPMPVQAGLLALAEDAMVAAGTELPRPADERHFRLCG